MVLPFDVHGNLQILNSLRIMWCLYLEAILNQNFELATCLGFALQKLFIGLILWIPDTDLFLNLSDYGYFLDDWRQRLRIHKNQFFSMIWDFELDIFVLDQLFGNLTDFIHNFLDWLLNCSDLRDIFYDFLRNVRNNLFTRLFR